MNRTPSPATTAPAPRRAPKGKNIIICSDGTGNTAIKGRGTNVFKLFEAIDLHGHRTNPRLDPQLAFYDDGVGTESFKPLKILGGAAGWGLKRNVMQLYKELARVYDPEDRIFLFGFSRGAFTVRTLAGMIVTCGVLQGLALGTTQQLAAAVARTYRAYRAGYDSHLTGLVKRALGRPDRRAAILALHDTYPFHRDVRIRFVGVWDTVDAVGMPFAIGGTVNRWIYQFKFPTQALSERVDRGCHALAIDEERSSFLPVLWRETKKDRQRIEQVWFSGVHSNVGGGYPKQGMSLVALEWMLRRAIECGLRAQPLDLQLIHGHASVDDKLYDPRAGRGVFYRWAPRDIEALCSTNGVPPKLHLTVLERIAHGTEDYAPGNLPPGATVVITEAGDAKADAATRIRADAVQVILRQALAARPNLLGEVAPAIKEGQISYWLFMASWLALLVGAVGTTVEAIQGSLTLGAILTSAWTVIASVVTLQWGILLETLSALLFSPLRIVAEGAVCGFLVAWWLARHADGRLSAVFSGFWHEHQAAFRNALKRARADAVGEHGDAREPETSFRRGGVAMNGAQQVEARLRAIMQAWPLPIEPGCEHHLTQLIGDSARRVEADGFASDLAKLAEVDASFRRLLTEMTRQAGALGFNELHEPTFFNALQRLCPLWPFC